MLWHPHREEDCGMCEYVVKRQLTTQEGVVEYRTKEGNWNTDAQLAYGCSEEDAKAIVRTVEQADRPPAQYSYDYMLVEG